jgi:hypothetical protein
MFAPSADGAGGSSTGGSSTGGGVNTAPCLGLLPLGTVLSPKDLPSSGQDDLLQVTPTSDDGRRITAVFARKDAAGTFALRHTTLRPWDDWPQDSALGPMHAPGIESISRFEVGRSGASEWAAVVRAVAGPRLIRGLAAEQGGTPPAQIPLPGIEPVFVSRRLTGPEAHLVGTFDVMAKGQVVRATFVDAAGTPTELEPLGCANGQPLRAAAVPFQDHWLVAISRSPLAAGCETSSSGAPTELTVLEVNPGGPHAALVGFSTGDTIIDVHAAPHPAGLYAVWSRSVVTGARVFAARVERNTGLTVGPVEIVAASAGNTSFTAGAVGDKLAVAQRDGPNLVVSIWDESLTKTAEATLVSGNSMSPTALYGPPDGEGVVATWSENVGGQYRVYMARLDCVP